MNNDELSKFIESIGVMTEIWFITYKSFIKLGLNEGQAVFHTREMIAMSFDMLMERGMDGE